MKLFSLILKSILGIVFLVIIIGAALFIPFGNFHYNLAWWYLSLFTISVISITVYLILFDKHLLKSRISGGPIAETRPAQKIIQLTASVVFLGIFILSALDYKNKWSNVPISFSYLSFLFCLAAFVWVFFVFKQNTFLSATIELQKKQQVISTGLYSVVRHPMYTGVLILLLFTPIALGSYYGLLAVIILLVVIIFRAMDEEKELKQNLEGYKAYCEKVKFRLFPFVF